MGKVGTQCIDCGKKALDKFNVEIACNDSTDAGNIQCPYTDRAQRMHIIAAIICGGQVTCSEQSDWNEAHMLTQVM